MRINIRALLDGYENIFSDNFISKKMTPSHFRLCIPMRREWVSLGNGSYCLQ